jgi:hypothetical protein
MGIGWEVRSPIFWDNVQEMSFQHILEIGAVSGFIAGAMITFYVWMRDGRAKK